MIDTEKVVGFYTDVFGNEIYEYEQIERYSIRYEGVLFEGDKEGYNERTTDSWDEAITRQKAALAGLLRCADRLA